MFGKWCRSYQSDSKNPFPGQGNPRDEELFKLKRELKDVKEERDILKKAMAACLCQRQTGLLEKRLDIYRFMQEHKNEFRVGKMAKVLNVSENGYYIWCRSGCPDGNGKDSETIIKIKELQEENRYRRGSPMIHKELLDAGISIGHNKTARLMRENGLNCRTKKAFKVVKTTQADETKTPSPNLLERGFAADRPNQKWVSDITYVLTTGGWVYLCVIIDLFSRRIIGWSVSENIDAELVCDSLRQAYQGRGMSRGVIVHSDRGSQYASAKFRSLIEKNEGKQSMSAKGDPWDNAVAESFFSTLKCELFGNVFIGKDHVEREMFEYIELYYNRKRRHSYIGLCSPVSFEENYREKVA